MRSLARYLSASALLCFACSSQAPTTGSAKPEARASGGASASAAASATTSSVASASVSASAAPPAPSASSVPPPMPSAVTECVATGSHLGAYVPTVADVQAALGALRQEACLKKEIAADAIAACAAKLGKTAMTISTDALGDTKGGCQVTIQGAEWGGRRWVVIDELHREVGTFFGGSNAVEMLEPKPVHYLDALGGKHSELCSTTASGGAPVKEADLPPGWSKLPDEVKRFLCNGSD